MLKADNREIADIKKRLSDMMASDHLVHSYLFAGGSAEQRLELGRWFAQALMCVSEGERPCGKCLQCRKFLHGNQEDYTEIEKPEGSESIPSALIEELLSGLKYKPSLSRHVVLIKDAQLIREDMQNKLLKTLEEPSEGDIFILLAGSEGGLLDTVRSRCSVFALPQESSEVSEEVAAAAKKLKDLVLSDAPYYRRREAVAFILAAQDDRRRKLASDLLDAFEDELREAMIQDEKYKDERSALAIARAAESCERSRRSIRQMHSVAFTLKQLCLTQEDHQDD